MARWWGWGGGDSPQTATKGLWTGILKHGSITSTVADLFNLIVRQYLLIRMA